jgi:hypothetical protein
VQAKRAQLGSTGFNLAQRYSVDEIWDKVGEVAIEMGVSPKTFVDAVFAYNRVSGGPFPHQLYGRAVRRWVEEYKTVEGSDIEVWRKRLQYMLESITSAVQTYSAPKPSLVEILLTPMYSSNFPEVLMCSAMPHKEIIHKYGPIALEVMEEDPALAEIMSQLKLNLDWIKEVPEH